MSLHACKIAHKAELLLCKSFSVPELHFVALFLKVSVYQLCSTVPTQKSDVVNFCILSLWDWVTACNRRLEQERELLLVSD